MKNTPPTKHSLIVRIMIVSLALMATQVIGLGSPSPAAASHKLILVKHVRNTMGGASTTKGIQPYITSGLFEVDIYVYYNPDFGNYEINATCQINQYTYSNTYQTDSVEYAIVNCELLDPNGHLLWSTGGQVQTNNPNNQQPGIYVVPCDQGNLSGNCYYDTNSPSGFNVVMVGSTSNYDQANDTTTGGSRILQSDLLATS